MATTADVFLDPRIFLKDQSKDELIDEILRLRQEKEALRKENEDLKKKLKPSFIKENGYQKKKRWKKLGRPVGHPGCTRPVPDVIDHVVEQTLERCPDCGHGNLSELPSELETHVQEDIVPAKVEATKFIRHGYWCPHCKAKKKAPYAPGEIPQGYLGPNILAQAILLKYFHGLPYSKIAAIFGELCSLKVSDGGLAQALQRLGKWLSVEREVVLKAVRESRWIHGDETGWKIAGIRQWLWDWVNDKWALYQIRRGRGRNEAKEVLGENYQGTQISDFLPAYDKTGKRRQRCWVHLFREIRNIRDPTPEERAASKELKRIYADACRLARDRGKLAPWVFARRLALLEDRLLDLGSQSFQSATWKRLSARILKYHNEFLTFVEVPGVSPNNNHAERMIRPNVIFRKISFQNMSRKGADAHEVLMSLLQSLRLQGRTPIPFFKTAYLRHRQGNPAPIFSC
jgi:transposase